LLSDALSGPWLLAEELERRLPEAKDFDTILSVNNKQTQGEMNEEVKLWL
jgi:hypothetical protein